MAGLQQPEIPCEHSHRIHRRNVITIDDQPCTSAKQPRMMSDRLKNSEKLGVIKFNALGDTPVKPRLRRFKHADYLDHDELMSLLPRCDHKNK